MTRRVIAAALALLAAPSVLAQSPTPTSLAAWNFDASSLLPTADVVAASSTLIILGPTPATYAAGVTGQAVMLASLPPQGTGNASTGFAFCVSSVGFTPTTVRFNARRSATGVRHVALGYRTSAGAAWFDFALNTATGAFWDPSVIDLAPFVAAAPALANNADVCWRLVAVFAPLTNAYAAAVTTSTYAATGTLRVDDVAVAGVPYVAPPPTPSPSAAPFSRVAVGYDWAPVDAWMARVSTDAVACGSTLLSSYSTFGLLVGNASHLLYRNSVGASFNWAASMLVGTASQWVSAAIIYKAMELYTSVDTPTTPIGNYLTLPAGLRNVTLRQLLSHTGGLASTQPCTEAGLTTTVSATSLIAFDACIDLLLRAPHNVASPAALPQGPPGSKHFFNGGSMQLAAVAAMAASSMALDRRAGNLAPAKDVYSDLMWTNWVGTFLRELLEIEPGQVFYVPVRAGNGTFGNPALTHGLRIRPHDYAAFLQRLLNFSFLPGTLFNTNRLEDDGTPGPSVTIASSQLPEPWRRMFHSSMGHYIECRDDSVVCDRNTRARGAVSNNGFYPYMDRSLGPGGMWAVLAITSGSAAGSLTLGDQLWPLISSIVAPGRAVTPPGVRPAPPRPPR